MVEIDFKYLLRCNLNIHVKISLKGWEYEISQPETAVPKHVYYLVTAIIAPNHERSEINRALFLHRYFYPHNTPVSVYTPARKRARVKTLRYKTKNELKKTCGNIARR